MGKTFESFGSFLFGSFYFDLTDVQRQKSDRLDSTELELKVSVHIKTFHRRETSICYKTFSHSHSVPAFEYRKVRFVHTQMTWIRETSIFLEKKIFQLRSTMYQKTFFMNKIKWYLQCIFPNTIPSIYTNDSQSINKNEPHFQGRKVHSQFLDDFTEVQSITRMKID